MQKIIRTDRVKNEEVLRRVEGERNILHTIKRKAKRIGHNLRRNCVLREVTSINGKIEGIVEVMG
jgi:hypothetical protein